VAASVVAALAVGAGAVYQGTSGDRQLAGSYRAVLAQGHGSFFAAAPLRGPAGTVGTVFGYQGRPSWLFATVHLPNTGPQRFDVQLVTRDGRHLPVGTAVLGGAHDSWGAQIPIDLTNLAQLRFVAAGGQTTIVANLNARTPGGPADRSPGPANPKHPRAAGAGSEPGANRRGAVPDARHRAWSGHDASRRLRPGGTRPSAGR
jgi:hypothetical protein